MKLKTYLCQSMEQALKTIRTELGPDAVIISSLNEGEQIRVTAACESSPHTKAPSPQSERTYSELETKNALCHVLSYHQVPASTADQIITRTCHLPPEVFQKGLSGVLEALFSFQSLSFTGTEQQPRQIMLAGQVGVGKTVTLAKIASEFVLQGQPVELISADHLKAGAAEQIQIYANALNVPLTLVETPENLEKTLSLCQAGVTYLIDTPGTNILNKTEVDSLTNFILAAKQAPYLVLPAGADAYELKDHVTAFKDLGCTRFIMTRLDAAKRLGGLMTVLQDEKLECAALSCGPEIGSRLKPAKPDFVIPFLLKHLPNLLDTHERVYDLLPQQKKTAEVIQSTSPHSPSINQPSTQPQKPLPAWIKGTMEAQKA